jgi:hypothetical protein
MSKNILGVDTSVLNFLNKYENYKDAFDNLMTNNNLTLLIPNGSALEFCVRSNPEESKKAIKWLALFIKNNYPIIFGHSWMSLIRKEMRCSFTNPPVFSNREINNFLKTSENSYIPQNVYDHQQKGKILFFENDSFITSEANKKDSGTSSEGIDQVKDRFENYSGPNSNNVMLSVIEKIFKLKPLNVLLYRDRYKTAYTTATLFEYYTYGLLVRKEIKSKSSNPIYQGSGKQKNTHEDHRIAAECSYCKYFLTEDMTLFKRCRELSNKRLLPFEPIEPLNKNQNHNNG